jgi:hypothetical protein
MTRVSSLLLEQFADKRVGNRCVQNVRMKQGYAFVEMSGACALLSLPAL